MKSNNQKQGIKIDESKEFNEKDIEQNLMVF